MSSTSYDWLVRTSSRTEASYAYISTVAFVGFLAKIEEDVDKREGGVQGMNRVIGFVQCILSQSFPWGILVFFMFLLKPVPVMQQSPNPT